MAYSFSMLSDVMFSQARIPPIESEKPNREFRERLNGSMPGRIITVSDSFSHEVYLAKGLSAALMSEVL